MKNFIIILVIMSIIISILTAMAYGNLVPGIMVGCVWFIIGLIIYGIWRLIVKSSSFVSETVKEKVSHNTVDNSYYAIAEQEIVDASLDKGLWAKALVNAKGSEDIRKAEYIKLRARKLQKENISEDIIENLATEQEDAEAQYNLGVYYSKGRVMPQNDTEAAKWFQLAANQGNMNAQFSIGNCYYNGEGVSIDHKEAVKWFTLAANQGHTEAQNSLGVYYYGNSDMPPNYTEAVKWFTLAAEHGDVDAQHNLGVCYAKGRGLPQNDTEAVKWFTLSANQGHADAQHKLEDYYTKGQSLSKNNTEAVKWQPIATAPKDGSDILGFSPTDGQDIIYWDEEHGRWIPYSGYANNFIRWMPLKKDVNEKKDEIDKGAFDSWDNKKGEILDVQAQLESLEAWQLDKYSSGTSNNNLDHKKLAQVLTELSKLQQDEETMELMSLSAAGIPISAQDFIKVQKVHKLMHKLSELTGLSLKNLIDDGELQRIMEEYCNS